MSFLNLQDGRPAGQIDQVAYALEKIRESQEHEYQAAVTLLKDISYSNVQIAKAFVSLGYGHIDASKVGHFRRKMREGKVNP